MPKLPVLMFSGSTAARAEPAAHWASCAATRGLLRQASRRAMRALTALATSAAVLFGPGAAAASPAAAAEPDSLQRIAKSGRIVLGARDHSHPISYSDGAGAHLGYHMEICLRVVAALRQRFDLPPLKVVTVPTTAATRFSLLNNRTVDIECGYNAVTPTAQQQALVSHATIVSEIRVMVREAQKGLALPDLAGRSVGVVVGSTAIPSLRLLTRSSTLKITEVAARHSADVFAMLDQGRVDAISLPQAYLLAQRAQAAEPGRFFVLDAVLRSEPVAVMFRLEDERMHAVANEVIAGLMRSGEMALLYAKWFQQPIPGLPTALGLPPSPATLRIFAKPGDETGDL